MTLISADHDPRWSRVTARDAAADGAFVYAVRSTGVYCRPSCPSRQAKPANVRFYDTPAEAEAEGYRPCLRCNPKGQSSADATTDLVAAACRLIEASDEMPRLEDLAARIGLSPHYFHRRFKAATGLTPRQWAAAHRAQRFRTALRHSDASVTGAIHEAGFGANSRFYEYSDKLLGMTPTAYRKGGKGMRIHFAVGQCSLGAILVAETARGICAITLGDDAQTLLHDLQDRFPGAELIGGDAEFETRVAAVVGFVEAPRIGLDLPLDMQGTAFQQRVWQALLRIPAGQTLSYSQLADAIGAPGAVRAVAGACAANKIAVAIPCHRVLRNDGALSGYRWGVDRKRALLAREADEGHPGTGGPKAAYPRNCPSRIEVG